MIFNPKAIDYEKNMELGCYVETYEESLIFQYIWGLRWGMYGGMI